MRNKPKEPPKVPKAAPFFLPTIAGLQPKFAPIEEDKDTDKVSKVLSVVSRSQAMKLLSSLFYLEFTISKNNQYTYMYIVLR